MTKEEIRFMWAVQALAQPAEVQISLFPECAEVADELALEHEETQSIFLKSISHEQLNCNQRKALAALDRHLEDMSSQEDQNLWTMEALYRRPEWENARALANVVIDSMKWSHNVPPTNRGAVYVNSSLFS